MAEETTDTVTETKAFYEEKGWWKSRTVWAGLIGLAFSAAAMLGYDTVLGADQPMVLETVMAVVSAAAIIFRTIATKKISGDVIPAPEA